MQWYFLGLLEEVTLNLFHRSHPLCVHIVTWKAYHPRNQRCTLQTFFGHMNRPAKTDPADFVRDHSRPQLPAQMWRTLSQVVLYFSASLQQWIIGKDPFWPQLTIFVFCFVFSTAERVSIERRDRRQFNHGFVPNCYVLYKTQTAYLCGTKKKSLGVACIWASFSFLFLKRGLSFPTERYSLTCVV